MQKNKRNTVLLVGAGALEKSWDPIISALKQKYPCNRPLPKDVNFVFADLVFRLRWLKHNIEHTSAQNKPRFRDAFTNDFEFFKEIKTLMVEKIREAQQRGSLKLHALIDLIDQNYVDERATMITTNWDTTLEVRFPRLKKEIVHIHGSIEKGSPFFFLLKWFRNLIETIRI